MSIINYLISKDGIYLHHKLNSLGFPVIIFWKIIHSNIAIIIVRVIYCVEQKYEIVFLSLNQQRTI